MDLHDAGLIAIDSVPAGGKELARLRRRVGRIDHGQLTRAKVRRPRIAYDQHTGGRLLAVPVRGVLRHARRALAMS